MQTTLSKPSKEEKNDNKKEEAKELPLGEYELIEKAESIKNR
ncbi:hypothetical protein [Anaerococcus porci]|nr:hypothetical protein [Anaerococcus porci]